MVIKNWSLILVCVLAACGGGNADSTHGDTPTPPPVPLPSPPPPDPGAPEPSDSPVAPAPPDVPPDVLGNTNPSSDEATTPPVSDDPGTVADNSDDNVVDDDHSEPPPDTTPPDTGTTPPPPAPRIVSFQTSASCIIPGETVILTWETKNATWVTLDGSIVKGKGSKTIRLTTSQTTHTLLATANERQVRRDLTVYLKMLETINSVVEEPLDIEVSDLQASADGTLLVLAQDIIYKGSRGENFDRLNPRDFRTGWTAVAIDPEDSDILYAARTGRIYRSINGGNSWPDVIPIRRNNRDLEINAVTVSANRLFVGFSGGGFKVDLSGPSLNLMSDLNTKNIVALAAKGTLAVATDGSALFRSTNTGGSWRAMSGVDFGEIRSLNIHSGIVYASAENGLYAYDGGWNRILERSTFQSKFISIDGAQKLYAATRDGVFKKNGTQWEEIMPQRAHWLFEDDGLRAVSNSAIMGFTEQTRYSNYCPLQMYDIISILKPEIRIFHIQLN